MAQLTTDAKWLGFRADKVLLRADYVSESSLDHATPGVELLIYHSDRYDNLLQTYGVFLSHSEAMDLIARLDRATCNYDAAQARKRSE